TADIDAVLRSILVDDKAVWTEALKNLDSHPLLAVAEGTYRLGIFSGHASRRTAAVYIGKQARQEYRLQQIASLEQQLVESAQIQENLFAVCNELRQQLARAGQARDEFLDEKEIREIENAKQAVGANITRQEKRVEECDLRLRTVAAELQALREQLQTVSAGLKLSGGEVEYLVARQAMSQYQHNLYQLELCHRDYVNNRNNLGQCQERLSEIMADVDGLKGELLILDGQINGLKFQIDQINNRLREMGAEELRERVYMVAKRLEEIPREAKLATETVTKLETGLETDENHLAELKVKTSFCEQLSKCWQQALDDELRLGLVYPGDQPPPGINHILQQQEKLFKQDKLDRMNVTERLQKSFYVENNILMEYRMQLEPIQVQFEATPQFPEDIDQDDSMASELEKLLEKVQRQIITLDHDGRRQNPYQMQKVLEMQISVQTAILSEKDKELYEEVIMNSIGRIISRRIQAAQQWVADMTKLMGQRDNSSGLKLKLEWKARLSEKEEELDIQDLVRLLHADPALLREEDLRKIVRHFQTRIERAKQASENMVSGNENTLTFQRAIREVLDYRLWFQFKLFYEQSGIPWRELTDKMFFKFSGGEKAMAMYIPLFSAAYSRYQEARPDAPYIITLDEAFAGVDENNIRDTFSLVEQLGFNYIMNSQALWGDYDVVPALSIYELIRPKNAPYVTVVRYYWNGRIRSLLAENEAPLGVEDFAAAANE
ncbi:MAG TPA: SbcC/MukB-like Walker B domain-containing protein, partial [Bacillota bacterium]|nr:SbcC/MukB-like Walker B domain-containing protein [Bacillota bacterium]